jgi:hypothetical protein
MIFATRKKLKALRDEHKKELERKDPTYLLTLYSENPELWKKMAAASFGVDQSIIEARYTGDKLRHLAHYAKVIRALAQGLQEVRNER